MEGGATVFADASEEFASLEGVKQRLEEFKLRCLAFAYLCCVYWCVAANG